MESVLQYQSLAGKKVVLQFTLPDEPDSAVQEANGTLELVNELGALFKPKGRASTLFFTQDVVGIVEDSNADDKIKSKRINPIEDSKVKQHLVDRHGYGLELINKMSVEEAVEEHNEAHQSDENHKELGHYHKVKAVRAKTETVPEAATA